MLPRRALPFLLLLPVASALYGRTILHDFVHDDRRVIVRDVPRGWGAFHRIDDLRRVGRQATFRVEHVFWDLNPAGYHAGNILLHALACSTWGLLLLRLGVARRTALLAALLMCVHPACVEAVACAANRKEMLAMTLGCACLLAHHRWPRGAGRAWVALAWAASLACKEVTLFLPLLFPLWDSMTGRGRSREAVPHALPFWIAAALLTALYDPAAGDGEGRRAIHKQFLEEPLATRAATAPCACAEGVLRMIWPAGFRGEYASDLSRSLLEPRVLASCAFLGGLAAWALRTRRREIRWGISWYAAHWLLVSNLPRAVAYVMADRYLYIPGAGACLVAAALLRARGAAGRIATAVLLTAWSAHTAIRCGDWARSQSLFPSAVLHAPRGSESQRGLGEACWNRFLSTGQREDALRARRAAIRSLEAYADDAEAAVLLGNTRLAIENDPRGAETCYRRALAAGYPAAWCSIGFIRLHQGDREAARAAFDRFLSEGRSTVPEGYARHIEEIVQTLR